MNKDKFDDLELLIIMAMDANHKEDLSPLSTFKRNGNTIGEFDVGSKLKFNPIIPNSCYTFDLTDEDRLFTASTEMMIENPIDIIGRKIETIIFAEEEKCLKWLCLKRLNKKPNDVYSMQKVSDWYEMHYRVINLDGSGTYNKRVIGLTKSGQPCFTHYKNVMLGGRDELLTAMLSCSLIEDCYRPNSMMATLSDAISLKFPVPLDDYKEVFFGRNSPLKNGRKRPIIHWVSQHLRKTKKGSISNVKSHVRGVENIVINGYKINIKPNKNTRNELKAVC